jgi:hypothetical protein
MAITETISTNTWDRGPNQERAQYLGQLQRRRDRIFNEARHLVTARHPRRRDLVLKRLERLAGLHAEYVRLGTRILDVELL